jgi:hypothetical protein
MNKTKHSIITPPIMGVMILLSCFSHVSKTNNIPIKKVRITVAMPYISEKGKVSAIPDTIDIYFQGNYLIITNEHYLVSDDKGLHKTGVDYLGKHKNDAVGFYYKAINSQTGTVMLADSFISHKNTLGFKKLYDPSLSDLLVRREFDKEQHIIKEVYAVTKIEKLQNDKDIIDSVFISYNKNLSWTNLSFSETLDSFYHSKVCKVAFHQNANYRYGYKSKTPALQMVFEMTEQPVTNLGQMKDLFAKLKKDHKTYLARKK